MHSTSSHLLHQYLINIWSYPVVCVQFPFSVFKVWFVCLTVPLCSAPASTVPFATLRSKWFAPAFTVKLAMGISKGRRWATVGQPASILSEHQRRAIKRIRGTYRNNLQWSQRERFAARSIRDNTLRSTEALCCLGQDRQPSCWRLQLFHRIHWTILRFRRTRLRLNRHLSLGHMASHPAKRDRKPSWHVSRRPRKRYLKCCWSIDDEAFYSDSRCSPEHVSYFLGSVPKERCTSHWSAFNQSLLLAVLLILENIIWLPIILHVAPLLDDLDNWL